MGARPAAPRLHRGLTLTVAAAAATLTLPEAPNRRREPWRIQRPRVPREIRCRFARVSLAAATVWAAVALYLSIVPTYAGALLGRDRLALLATISAVALLSSFVTQLAARRRRGSPQRAQAVGLTLLALGLLALVLTAPLNSLALLVIGSVVAGSGRGVAFLNAQEELNDAAPSQRRGEVTSAFIGCIYALVAGAVLGTGLLAVRFSLSLSVGVVSTGLLAVAVVTAVISLRSR